MTEDNNEQELKPEQKERDNEMYSSSCPAKRYTLKYAVIKSGSQGELSNCFPLIALSET